jgi:hypothetical protein
MQECMDLSWTTLSKTSSSEGVREGVLLWEVLLFGCTSALKGFTYTGDPWPVADGT